MTEQNPKKPAIMAPAGNWPSLRAAVEAGTDEVYFGIAGINMRVTAKNFELSEISKVVSYCHENNVKAFLTINTIIYENELDKVSSILDAAKVANIDGVICWDNAVIMMCKEKGINFVISTQASISNSKSAEFYKELGASRVVLARECTIDQVKEIRSKVDIEIEAFIHGAMCVSESGRCFISQFQFGKSANRGDCIQPCRREYKVYEPEEGNELVLDKNYVMSPKDLCSLEFIDQLIEAGIDSFKIEGRARSPEYVKATVGIYRKAIDLYFSDGLNTDAKSEMMEELGSVFNRGFSSGFFMGKPINEWTDKYGSKATTKKVYVGYVKNYYQKIGVVEIALQSRGLFVGEELMIQGPTTGVQSEKISSMQWNHTDVEEIEKGKSVAIKIDFVARPNDKVFIIEKA